MDLFFLFYFTYLCCSFINQIVFVTTFTVALGTCPKCFTTKQKHNKNTRKCHHSKIIAQHIKPHSAGGVSDTTMNREQIQQMDLKRNLGYHSHRGTPVSTSGSSTDPHQSGTCQSVPRAPGSSRPRRTRGPAMIASGRVSLSQFVCPT